MIDGGERRQDLRALGRGEHRPPRALQPSDRRVVVEPDHERIAERARGGEVADVPGMDQIEAAVREHDASAARAQRPEPIAQRRHVGRELRNVHATRP